MLPCLSQFMQARLPYRLVSTLDRDVATLY